ncbi:FecR family protein [Wenyingzhuangia sp. IMCC45533]
MERFVMTKSELWAYISNTANPETIQRVEEWLSSPDYDEALFREIETIYLRTLPQKSPSLENAKDKFFKTVQPKTSTLSKFYKYAAILVIAVLGTYAIQYVSTEYASIVVTTGYAEQKQISLPDGSTVWLNASSTLSYTKKHPRTLNLKGEAFFKVAKDKEHPFTVTTLDDIIVKALGTSFNVKSYSNGVVTETKLLTGKVEVSSEKHFDTKFVLIPNEKIVFYRDDKKAIKSAMSIGEQNIGWKQGKIQFKNKSFKEIALDLRAQFNIHIKFENEVIANSKFSGSFDQSTPIAEIFEMMNYSKNFNYNLKTTSNEWIIK